MVSDEELAHLQKVARLKAKDLTRDYHDREDVEQEALLAAMQQPNPEWAAQSGRWAASRAMRKVRRRRREMATDELDVAADTQRSARHWSPHQERDGYGVFVKKGQGGVERPIDVQALKALPSVREAIDDLIRRALAATGGRIELAATAIRMGHTTLKRRLHALRVLGLPTGQPERAPARGPAAARSQPRSDQA